MVTPPLPLKLTLPPSGSIPYPTPRKRLPFGTIYWLQYNTVHISECI